jgi:hypothetical protein
MKNFLLLFSICIYCNPYFSQSRKSIIKEINSYKHKTYTTANYTTEYAELQALVKSYFIKEDYNIVFDNVPSRDSYSKKVTLASSKGYTGGNGFVYRESREKNIVHVYTITNADGTNRIEISESIRDGRNRFSKDFSNKSTLGNYKFNKDALYKFLYNFFNKQELIYPKEIEAKIETYNNSLVNPKKKIIKGRDY